MTPERDVALHEAGHQVVAEHFELPIAEVHLAPDGNSGFVRFEDTIEQMGLMQIEGSEDRWKVVVSLVAGAVAEALAAGVPASEHRDWISDGDMDAVVAIGVEFAELRGDGSLDLTSAVERAEEEAGRSSRRDGSGSSRLPRRSGSRRDSPPLMPAICYGD